MTKNYLVTGGAGFIGSCFVHQRCAEGHNVIVLDALTYAGHKANIDGITNNKPTLVTGNICDRELVDNLLTKHNIDYVVNFAAESHVDNSISNPGEFIETNINGTYTMLEASRHYYNGLEGNKKSGFRFLHVSTDEVYGTLGDEGKFNEDYPYQPNSPYSASKAASDHLVRAWFHTYAMPVITTNCTNNYGPRQFPEKLIPLMVTNALNDKKLPVYGAGTNIRDWIFVEDHCNGVNLALTKGKLGESYCFGGNSERTNNQVVDAICTILDDLCPRADGKPHSSAIEFVTDRLGHDFRYAMDDSKALAELGYTHSVTFEQGLRKTIEWYLSNSDWVAEVNS